MCKTIFLENKNWYVSVIGIFTAVMASWVAISSLFTLTSKFENNVSIMKLTEQMTQGMDVDISLAFFGVLFFGILLVPGMVLEKQIKYSRNKLNAVQKATLPSSVFEKYSAFFVTSVIYPIVGMLALSSVSYLVGKTFIWLQYSATINLDDSVKFVCGGGLMDEFGRVCIALMILFSLIAVQVIVSIYNTCDKHTYVKYLRTLIVVIVGVVLLNKRGDMNESVNLIFGYTLYPLITISLWVWSYWLFKNKEISN